MTCIIITTIKSVYQIFCVAHQKEVGGVFRVDSTEMAVLQIYVVLLLSVLLV